MKNKNRFIDYEQAIRATYEEIFWTESEQAVVRHFLATLPSVEVVHGKWIDRGYEVECPFCGFTCNDTHYLGNGAACPNCAARMDG